MELSIKVKDDLVQTFGAIYIQAYLQKQIQLLELQILAEKLSTSIQEETDTNWEAEFEQARQEAWEEYKVKFIPWQLA
ncbi:MAG: hypothetical protein MUE81_13205 [Thermoflexibacter sp.]|jgi:hypothetical protein|nr:hypothetical protein [Thermoflexibacter sp.]